MGIPNTKEATFTDGSGSSGDILNINTSAGQIEIPNAKPIIFYTDAYTTAAGQIKNGNLAPAQSATAVAITNGGTIATANIGVSRLNPAAARTGCIMAAGTLPGQQCWVVNEAAVALTVQMDVQGTSNVADGINCIIPGLSAKLFVWDSGTSLWYEANQTINGTIDLAQSATAFALGQAGTITTAGVGVARISPVAARTACIMQAGTLPGQMCLVVNEAAYANSVQMDVQGTSNVADGGNCFIPGLSSRLFVWDSGTSLWYEYNIQKIFINASQALTVNDGTNDVFNVNTNSKRVELVNNTLLRIYSDSGYTTRTVELSNGTISLLQSTSAAAIGQAGTITTSGVGIARLSPAAARTACIMQAGTLPGQLCWVVNEAAVNLSVQMDVAGTSNVADGINCIIPGLSAKLFVWDGGTSLWYEANQTINGTINFAQSATAPDPGAGGTITTSGVGVARTAPASNRTGIILQAGTFPGQMVTVINESGANTLTFNTTPATSNVADAATQAAIGVLTARSFIWDSSTSLWYQMKAG